MPPCGGQQRESGANPAYARANEESGNAQGEWPAALVVIHRRPAWFGALAGLGASIKVWPIVLLFGEWEWSASWSRRLPW